MKSADSDSDFVANITPDVLRVLHEMKFFQKLDDLFVPDASSCSRAKCSDDFTHTIAILTAAEMSNEDVADILSVLNASGACCDCEVLYNVCEESRLKAEYWTRRLQETLQRNEN